MLSMRKWNDLDKLLRGEDLGKKTEKRLSEDSLFQWYYCR